VWVPAAIIAAAALVAIVVLALQRPVEFDEGTPQGLAQRYVRALVDGDFRTAVGYLDEALGCRRSDLRYFEFSRSGSFTVRLTGTHIEGDAAEIDLVISEHSGPFGAGYDYQTTLVMERRRGEWIIVETPWPLYQCYGEVSP
jgi:hypothetical protein